MLQEVFVLGASSTIRSFFPVPSLSPAAAGTSLDAASTSGLSLASTRGLVGGRGSARRGGSVVAWQWRGDDGAWHNYSGILEDAYLQGEDEISLSTLGRMYTVDFQVMLQIDEDTGTTRSIVRRRVGPDDASMAGSDDALSASGASLGSLGAAVLDDPDAPGAGSGLLSIVKVENEVGAGGGAKEDARAKLLVNEQELATKFMKSLFGIVYQVFSSSAGPAVKHKCLRALLRMVYFASPELLKNVLKAQEVSSQLAGMLSSTVLKVLVGALQLASIFLQRLPHLFGIHFRREGVLHRVQNLKKGVGLGGGNGNGNGVNNHAQPAPPLPSSSSIGNGASAVNNRNAQIQQQQQSRIVASAAPALASQDWRRCIDFVICFFVPQATNNVHGHGSSSSSQYQKPNAFVQHAYSTGYDHMGSADYGLSKHTNMAAELVNPTREPQLIRSLTSSRKHKERPERFNRMYERGDDRDAEDTDWEWHNRYDSDWDSVTSSVSTHYVNEVARRCRGEYRAVCGNSSSVC